jgi:sensor histidine kinase regulating citrate/malate metabolism
MRAQLQVESLLREQAKAQYRISKENIDAISIKCHDLKHQLLAVKNVIDPQEYDEIMEMINSYGAEIQTDNEVLDVVFQEKNFQCRKLGIQFTCIIDGKALDFIGTTDLYVLFGNLIDNAANACAVLPTAKREIKITCKRKARMLSLCVSNTTDGLVPEESLSGGLGLPRIRSIVAAHNGICSLRRENGLFTADLLLPTVEEGVAHDD